MPRRSTPRDTRESRHGTKTKASHNQGTAPFHDTTSHTRALCKREQMGQARSGPLHTPFLHPAVWPDVLGQSLSLLCAQEARMVRKKEDRDLKT